MPPAAPSAGRIRFVSDDPGVPATGSTLLRGALAAAVERFPAVFGDLRVPDAAGFKRELADLLVRFEARRAASEARVEVARFLAGYVPARARLDDRPIVDALRADRPAPERVALAGWAAPGWVPAVDWRGRAWRGAEIAALADAMAAEQLLTRAAADALRRVATRLDRPIDLRGERFVVLGAGAELAPTADLLAAGARVLWVDARPPQGLDPAGFAGTLVHLPGDGDLLARPDEVHAAIAAEAAEGPVHLGLFAYAPGGGRELLLTTAMNAIALALPSEAVRSVTMWVSPTTPGELQPDDREARLARRAAAPRWQRALARARVLREPAVERHGEVEVPRAIVPLQGPTYLAAQILGKIQPAEAWAVDRPALRVSANVAPITSTRSLEHPLFAAGFLGAPAFGIEVFRPDHTRVVATLLMLHDLFDPAAPAADPSPAARARRVGAQAVHGAVRCSPWVFEDTIRVAAVLGLARHPRLLLRLRG